MNLSAPIARRDGLAALVATRVAFFVAGLAMAAWAPLVPLAKARIGLDEATLGLVLLCFGGGSLVAMPVAGPAAARVGIRRVILGAVVAIAFALPSLAEVDHAVSLAAALFVFGAGLGVLDVAMNLQAIAVEREWGRPMMSGFHGLFSVGGICGASGVALALAGGVDAIVTMAGLALFIAVVVASTMRGLRTTTTSADATRFVFPHGVVIAIGLLAAAAFLVEGAVLDWSAIFLTSIRGVPMAQAGAGYVAFSIAMTIGRFTGDRMVGRFGGRRVLTTGALCSGCGIAIVSLAPSWLAGIAGFALVGIGNANIVPILFTSAGRQTAMPESLAVPAMTTMGYAGLLAGPALIGFASHATTLPIAFIGLAAMMIVVAVAGRTLRV